MFGVVLPIVGGLAKVNVPPKVNDPEVVTVPVSVNPFTVPAPETEVTVPVVGVAHEGTPAANVNTWPLEPANKNVVAFAPL